MSKYNFEKMVGDLIKVLNQADMEGHDMLLFLVRLEDSMDADIRAFGTEGSFAGTKVAVVFVYPFSHFD